MDGVENMGARDRRIAAGRHTDGEFVLLLALKVIEVLTNLKL